VICVVALAFIAGCTAIPVPAELAGPSGATTIATAAIQPESCMTCHGEVGAKHQASYDELYQDGVIQVTDLAYSFSAPDISTVTFKMTKDGAPFDGRKADALSIYFVQYTGTKFQFEPAAERLSLVGTLTYDGEGGITSTTDGTPDLGTMDGLIVVFGRDETVGVLPARVQQNRYPFAAILETGGGVDYVSAANNAGCEKCHTEPYLKHSYIYGEINHDPETDFYACKACHLDDGEGGHYEWQLLVDDPVLAAAYLAGEAELTSEQEAKYAYNTSLMNDVHMSHAMEFPYPQSMANCVTCHEDKLDVILADANFTVQTCKSCHPITGSEEYGTAARSLETLMSGRVHNSMDMNTENCIRCHATDGKASPFSEIHTGYNKVIYTAAGQKYSEAISVTIDSASFDGDNLNIKFSAAEFPDLAKLDVADIAPTVLVGLYGYDTKDFIIGPHERLFDDNGDGTIDSGDQRTLEYAVGEEHPRYTTVSAGGGSWEVTANLSAWADLIADDTVKRVEIAVLPALENADDVPIALNAPSRTFDLATNAFADDFYSPIVKVMDGCNNCHEALATTFHSPDRGGNIVVCRLCHITKSGGSHLEMQSRSIDSYVHAIHSFQAFDIGDIDFTDPVQAMHYEHHIEFPYPKHGITDCESCHVPGTNNVPDQSKSLPALLSASDSITGRDRNIGDVPVYVTGPASKACGGCHRAEMIKEDEAGELISFNQHTKQGGYLIEGGEDASGTLYTVIDKIMEIFR
jgi:OmcA/MtrC family decaheme c-type cytochrome